MGAGEEVSTLGICGKGGGGGSCIPVEGGLGTRLAGIPGTKAEGAVASPVTSAGGVRSAVAISLLFIII